MRLKFIYCITFLNFSISKVLADSSENVTHHNLSIHSLADALLNLINFDDGESNESNSRIVELRDKLANINKYVIDNDEINKLLVNVTKNSKLKEINFYKALLDSDHFRIIAQGDAQTNLYLKLKEKITRDDVMKILSEKGKQSDFLKSARKAMGPDYYGKTEKQIIDDVIDKLLAEVPNDVHNYSRTINDSMYWGMYSYHTVIKIYCCYLTYKFIDLANIARPFISFD